MTKSSTKSSTNASTNASRAATTKVTADLDDKASVSSDEDDLEVAQQRPERKSSNTLGNLTNRKTKLDSERANRARELHCAAGHPSDRVLKQMLDNGKFKECSLTGHDIDNSVAMLGVCPACQMANMAEPPAPPSQREPPRDDSESFQADILFVKNGHSRKSPYLLVTDERCGMMIGRFLGQRSAKYLHPAMDTIVGHIEAMTGRKPDRIFTDREKVFDDFQTYKRVKVTHLAPNRALLRGILRQFSEYPCITPVQVTFSSRPLSC